MTAPFRLSDGPARAWLADLIVAHELGEEFSEMGERAASSPRIGLAWNPQEPGEDDTVYLLVRAAQEAAVITGPPEASFGFEFIDDGDEGRYRWLLDVTAPAPLKLASPSEGLPLLGRAEALGAEAAAAILTEGVDTANLLLQQLSDHVSAIGPPDPGR